MKFHVASEDGREGFDLDLTDDQVAILRAHADAAGLTLPAMITSILESEIGRVWLDLKAARETFDQMRSPELEQLRAAFVADVEQAVREERPDAVRFGRGRVALIDGILTLRGAR